MSVAAHVRIPRDKPFQSFYRPEGATVTSGQTFAAGWVLARAAAGTLQVATEVPGLLPGGFATRDLFVADANGNDVAEAETGFYSVAMSALSGDAFTDTSAPAPIYFVDNDLFGALPYNSSTGAVRSVAGCFLRLDRHPTATNRCLAWIGPEGVAMAKGIAGNGLVAPTARAVITSIAAYTGTLTGVLTGTVNGALATQDGIAVGALNVGDRLILPVVTGGAGGATVAADSGPYILASKGGAGKFILVRPPEWYQSMTMPEALTYKVGTEGAAWSGSEWRAFPVDGARVVGTDDPHFWPRLQGYAYTIGTGFVADGGLGNAVFYLRTAHGFTAANQTSAHANWASTITTGAGTGALVFTGTASDVMVGQAINF